MPRDLEGELKRRQGSTDQLLSGISGETSKSIERARSGIASRNTKFFGNTVNPTLSSYGVNATAGGGKYSQNSLLRELNRSTAQRSMNSNRDRMDLLYQNAVRRAQEAGLSLDESVAYARQVAGDQVRRQFEAEQQSEDIASSRRKEDISEQYANRGIALQNQYMPDSGYQAALYRALFGLAGSAGTAYAINRSGNSGGSQYQSGQSVQPVRGSSMRDYQNLGPRGSNMYDYTNLK